MHHLSGRGRYSHLRTSCTLPFLEASPSAARAVPTDWCRQTEREQSEVVPWGTESGQHCASGGDSNFVSETSEKALG